MDQIFQPGILAEIEAKDLRVQELKLLQPQVRVVLDHLGQNVPNAVDVILESVEQMKMLALDVVHQITIFEIVPK